MAEAHRCLVAESCRLGLILSVAAACRAKDLGLGRIEFQAVRAAPLFDIKYAINHSLFGCVNVLYYMLTC